jgi:hypothetical protein
MQEQKIRSNLNRLGKEIASDLKPEGFWTGKLSSSALGVAVAITALHFKDPELHNTEIKRGLVWLADNINSDGSYGDSPGSHGNISTSLLVYAALNLPGRDLSQLKSVRERLAGYLSKQGIDVHSDEVARVILKHYKSDYSFSVPILTMCGLCGIPRENAFNSIPQLPFELLMFPGRFYRFLNLSVVSYALPALVAVGILIFKKKRSGFFLRSVRKFSTGRALKILYRMLPESGGYLEAIPLTAFVSLSLIAAGYGSSEIVTKGIRFLLNTQREDGSWPIDVDLSTWVTTLSVKAFRSNIGNFITLENQEKITGHLKEIQNTTVHPFNGTPPGGWGWTNYSGSVPDGDDTPGVMLALLNSPDIEKVKREVIKGGHWLLQLQNSDGGFPTFTRGWGKLPFDRSCSDLTGHGLLAISALLEYCDDELSDRERKKFRRSFMKALQYLEKNQNVNGSWLPLWFGNQNAKDFANPVYGTARVLTYLKDSLSHTWHDEETTGKIGRLARAGAGFLILAQNRDGSWGGNRSVPGTIEETALAVSALASVENRSFCYAGLEWIDDFRTRHGYVAAPIGLYFSLLWYDEEMYPRVFYLDALSRMLEIGSTQ